MKSKVIRILKVLFFAYIAICGALYFLQDFLIYHPQERAVSSEKSTLHLQSSGENIVITTSIKPSEKAIIYFGGNAEDVSINLSEFEQVFPNYSLYFMHYRGYGGSSGKPSEENIHKDAIALYELVNKNHPEISIIGRSLGSGVATRLASKKTISKLVLVTPFNSIEEIAQQKYPFVPISLLLHEKYKSWQYAKNVKAPTTILMAEKDNVIPNISTEKLYTNFPPGVANIVLIKDVGHNSISESEKYYPILKQAI